MTAGNEAAALCSRTRVVDVSQFPLVPSTGLQREGEHVYELPADVEIDGADVRDMRSGLAVHAVVRDRLTGKRYATTSTQQWRGSSSSFEVVWLR